LLGWSLADRCIFQRENQENIPVAELQPQIVVNQNGQVGDVQFTPTDQGWLVSFTVFNPNKAPTAMDVSCVILRREFLL